VQVFVNARLHVSGGALGGGRMVEDASSVAGLNPALTLGVAYPSPDLVLFVLFPTEFQYTEFGCMTSLCHSQPLPGFWPFRAEKFQRQL
jgi:hypothetical protein